MTNDEAKQAFLKQCPVIHNCRCSGSPIRYARIKEFIHEIREDGKLYLTLALIDDKGRCVVYARPADVREDTGEIVD